MPKFCRRSLVRFGVVLLLGWPGCQEQAPSPSAKTVELTAQAKQFEQTLSRIEQSLPKVEASACSDSAIRGAIAKSHNRQVPLLDKPSLALAAQGKPLDPTRALAHLVPAALKERRATSQVTDEQSATDAAFDALKLLKEYDYVAVLDYQLKAPKADGKGFHGGELTGKLALFELRSGKSMCAAPVFAQSHEEIAGKPQQSPQEAADIDFDLELRRVLQETLQAMSRELSLELG